MEKGTQLDLIERQFGHSLIKWKISNFCFGTSRNSFLISSPEFCVDGLQATKWKMTLNPKMKKGEEYAFHLSFERLERGEATGVIAADLKVWLLDSEGNECESVTHKSEFAKIQRLDMPLWNVSFIRERMKAELYKSGTLTIWCHMIIEFENRHRHADGYPDVGLRTLSENLLQLYQTGDDHDVILSIAGKEIPAHRAILFSRSTVLADMLATESTVVDLSSLPFLDYKSMQDIMEYFYSGDINCIAKSPSILMFECAASLNLIDIVQYYNPQKLEIHSSIDLREHTFLWAIKNFRLLHGDCVTSPVLTSDYVDATFVISFYTRNIDKAKSEHLAVFVDIVEGAIPQYSCLEISIVDEGDALYSEKMPFGTESQKRLGFDKYIAKDHFKTILKKISGDTLNITLKIELHNAAVFSTEKYALSTSCFSNNRYFESLSLHLEFILQQSIFTDTVLEAEGESINVHKCVLSARSAVFSKILQETKGDKFTIPSIKPNVLRLVIGYVYSGVYANSDPDCILEVYKAAVEFSLPSLKQKCLEILRENFDVQFLCDALIFSDEQEDVQLKNLALNFIGQNKKRVFEDSNFKSLIVNKPSLCKDIVETVNDRNDVKEIEA